MKRFCQFILLALLICLVSQTALAQPTLTIQGERAGAAFEIQFPADVADLDFSNFELTSITLPEGLTNLKTLDLSNNDLLSLTLPDGLTELEELYLYRNRLHFLTLPNDLKNLKTLQLDDNRLNSLVLPKGLANLEALSIGNTGDWNKLRSLTLPEGLRNLAYLGIEGNRLESLVLPEGLINLKTLDIRGYRLSSVTLPSGLANLETLNIYGGNLTSLVLPKGLTNLKRLHFNPYSGSNTPLETLFVRGDLYNSIQANRVSIAGINLEKVTFYAPPVLSISRMDGIMEITWNGGVLQSTTDLFGEWQDLESAESPLRILFPNEARRFFRLRL